MVVGKIPMFMQNKNWWTRDPETDEIVLTENAPIEAVISYKEYKQAIKEAEESSFKIEDPENTAMKMFGL